VTTARSILEGEVRELVRRRGLDPVVEQPAVARLIGEAVADYQDRATTSSLPPIGDTVDTSRALLDSIAGFGPLQPFLDDPSVEEIWINSPERVFVARRGRHELTNLMLTGAQVQELVERMLKSSGRRIDISRPFVDAMLPQGHRLHVVLEGISRGWSAVNIRKFVQMPFQGI
jgi:pilus assembly protein CpaF